MMAKTPKKIDRRQIEPRLHPSGRPIRCGRTVGRTVWRVPDEGFVTPRLRLPRRDLSMIGFMAPRYDYEDDDE